MKYAIVGYGRMGRAIEGEAARRGHELAAIVDPVAEGAGVLRDVRPAELGGARVAFEFSTPAAARTNVMTLLEAGVPVVCGTTGWSPGGEALRRATQRSGAGAVVAPNFSIGMNLFYAIVRRAAALVAATDLFDPYVVEMHHRAKADAPSGTARRLAAILGEAAPRFGRVQFGFSPDGPVPARAVHLASVRAGHEAGTHTVGFDGEHDQLVLTHRARGRGGFALGAVLAAEWIVDRGGLHGFDDVLEDLTAGKGEGS
jgi:4-hydroxy-tetrahydrodipicolinate reductase